MKQMKQNFLKVLLIAVFIGKSFYSMACTPLAVPTINNISVVGNNLILNSTLNNVWICNGYFIQVELVCFDKPFTGVAPFYHQSAQVNKTNTPFVMPTQTIPLTGLCPGTQYKVRIREGYGPFNQFSGWSAQAVFTTPGTALTPSITVSPNPVSLCPPQTQQLTTTVTNSCGGGPIGYTWTPTTGLSCANCANPVASPNTTTTYTVRTTGGPTGCWTASNVVTVNVITVPPVVGTVTAPASLCAGNAATVAISSYSGNLLWLQGPSASGPWTSVGANTLSLTTPTLSANTCFQASVTGCPGSLTSNTVCITVNPNPTVTVNSSVICQGFTSTLTANGANSYTWSPGPNTISVNSATVSPPATSSFTVIGSSMGCTNAAVANVTVNPTPTITAAGSSVCVGQTASLTANSFANSTYSWSGPQSFASNQQNPTIANAQANMTGIYTVVVTSSAGCVQSATVNMLITPLPTVTVVGNNTLCSQGFNGSQATTTLTSSGAVSYTWTLPAGFSAAPNNNTNIITVTPPVTALQTVATMSVLGSSGACTNSAVYNLTVMPNPTITPVSNSICAGFSGSLSVSGANTYSWSPSTALSSTNSAVVIANPSVTTVYNIIGNIAGCNSATQSSTMTVVPNPTVTIAPSTPSICYGTSIGLTAAGATNYTWSPNSAISSTTGLAVTVNPTVTTTYNLIGEQATCTGTTAITVTVVPLPVITIALSSPTLCMNNFNNSQNTVTVTASGATSYNWTGFSGLLNSHFAGSAITVTSALQQPIGSGTVIGTSATCTNIATFTVGAIPNPIISVSSPTMCFGTSATLTANGATDYFWSPPANLSATTGSVVIANPNLTTVYSVFGSSATCNSTTQTGTVGVVPLPVLNVSPLTPTICYGNNTVLNVNGATSYTWEPANSLDNPFNSVVVASPTITTNYTVTGSAATCTSSTIRQVQVIPLPNLQAFIEPAAICEGDKTTINAIGATSYSWSPSFGLSNPNSNFVVANPTVTTLYTLSGSNGTCRDSITVLISVLQKPVLNLSISEPKICYGTNTSIFASGAQSYSWSPAGTLNFMTNSAAVASPSTTTNYTIIGMNVTGSVTCVMTQEIMVEVVPTVTPNISNSVTICAGESTKLTAGGSNTYLWLPPSSLSNSTIPNPVATPMSTTIYTVNVSDFGFCGATATVLVRVNPTPTVSAGADAVFNTDEPMFIEAKGTGTISWIQGTGIQCKDCPLTQIVTKASGCYVAQTVNQFGCRAIDEVCVEITNDYNIYIPNIFTPNYDGMNDVFKVHGTGILEMQLTIFNRWGEELYTTTDPDKGWNGFYNGELSKNDVYAYLVTFKTMSGKIHTRTGHVTLMK